MNNLKIHLENIYEDLKKNENDIDYLSRLVSEDLLDYNLTFDSQKNLIDLKLYITLGGPNVWIAKNSIQGTWRREEEIIYIHESLSNKLFDLAEDFLII